MVEIQKLKCPDCGEVFEFDPNSDEKVLTNLKESFRQKIEKEKVVTAYLECPNGHTNPYKVTKEY